MKKEIVIKIFAEFFRILIGITFSFSGIAKAIDPIGGSIKIGEYLSSFNLNQLMWMDNILSFNLATLEFVLGFCLLMGVYRKIVTLGIFLFMCFMTPLTLYLAVFNPVADCGCFGEALIITNWETFFKNCIFLPISFFLFRFYKFLSPLYSYKTYWFVALFSYLFCLGFCYLNYNHLPIIDFRPYKVGKNISQMMEIPENAPQDEYLFIYEKNNVKKEFSLEEIPTEDSAWVYVDARLVKQGFRPEINSFDLYDENQNNIYEKVLQEPKVSFLLILPVISKASDENIDRINSIYDYAVENQLLFYGITGSSENDIAEWKKNTGADYPFLTADDVLLKTIIRSNPGLVLLKKGTILEKFHNNDLPTDLTIERILNDLEKFFSEGTLIANKKKQIDSVWLRIILGFTLPLLFVWIYDFFRYRKSKKKVIS